MDAQCLSLRRQLQTLRNGALMASWIQKTWHLRFARGRIRRGHSPIDKPAEPFPRACSKALANHCAKRRRSPLVSSLVSRCTKMSGSDENSRLPAHQCTGRSGPLCPAQLHLHPRSRSRRGHRPKAKEFRYRRIGGACQPAMTQRAGGAPPAGDPAPSDNGAAYRRLHRAPGYPRQARTS